MRSLSAANLPAHISALVDVVTPTTRFPAPLLPIKTPAAARSGLLGTNPTSIRTAYEMGTVQATHSGEVRSMVPVVLRWRGSLLAHPHPSPLPLQNNTQQAAGFLGQYVDPGSDLTSFFEEYYPAGKGRRRGSCNATLLACKLYLEARTPFSSHWQAQDRRPQQRGQRG